MRIGFHASHEQFTPSHLLKLVQRAEKAGFQAILSSDHFHPWSNEQGESGFAWSWLGAAMQATSLDFGIVNAPGQRYHPAIIAQAVATLEEMFPGRFWLCSGSGQALNENITGEKWPPKHQRNARLKESVEIMRELWKGEYVSRKGLIQIEKARLYTLPRELPSVYGAAMTEKTARWLGDWADGMITVSKPPEELEKVVSAFRERAGQSKPLVLKVQLSYDPSPEKALELAWEQWRNNIFPSKLLGELHTPDQFDDLGAMVRPEDLKKHVLIGSHPDDFLEHLRAYKSLGVDTVILHNVNEHQEAFIDFFEKELLPAYHKSTKN